MPHVNEPEKYSLHKGNRIQSVLINVNLNASEMRYHFDKLKRRYKNLNYCKPDVLDKYYRIRQYDPKENEIYRTFSYDENIKFIVNVFY